MIKVSLLLPVAAMLTGCAEPMIYSWGQYENVVYSTYSDPGKVPAERQIKLLEQDYQKARSENKPVSTGFHAHLGYLYAQVGKTDAARQSFETEKALFPESAVLMDRLLKNLEKQ
jgi:hypothetical protein